MTKSEIKTMTQDYDTRMWERELSEKKILKYYKEGKGKMRYEFCYRNNINSMFLARARLNSLRLEEALGRGKILFNKICKLCKQEEEDLLHFMIECPHLEGKRNYEIIDEEIIEPEKRLIQCLFKQRNYQETGKMIKNMWYTRRNMIEYEKKNKKIDRSNRNNTNITYSDPGPKRDSRERIRVQEGYGSDVGIIFGDNRGI